MVFITMAQLPAQMLALVVVLSVSRLARGGFPAPMGGCFAAPKGRLDTAHLPPGIAAALRHAEDTAAMVQANGVPKVETGLFSSPTAAISMGVM